MNNLKLITRKENRCFVFLSSKAFLFLKCHLAIHLPLLEASFCGYAYMKIILGFSVKRISYRLYFNNLTKYDFLLAYHRHIGNKGSTNRIELSLLPCNIHLGIRTPGDEIHIALENNLGILQHFGMQHCRLA